jgi:hypothetical protein
MYLFMLLWFIINHTYLKRFLDRASDVNYPSSVQPRKKVVVKKPHKWQGQGPNWAVEPYDDEYWLDC